MAADDQIVSTGGGAFVEDGVRIERGDFVGRDKNIYNISQGATVDEILSALRHGGWLSTLAARLSEEAFRELLDIFARVTLEDAGRRLYDACRVTLPATARLVNSETPAVLLANMCEQPLAQAWPPIFECLERFITTDGIPPTLATELREWTDSSAGRVNPRVLQKDIDRLRREIQAEAANAATVEAFSSLQVYLESDTGNRTYQRKQPLFHVELVLTTPKMSGGLVLPTPGTESDSDGTPLWTLDQLPSLLDQVFKNRETVALIPQVTLLVIEVIAPSDVLLYGFERWKRNQKEETYAMFAPMVVRLRDRLVIPDPADQKLADEYWQRKWNAFHSQQRDKTCDVLPWFEPAKLDAYTLQDKADLACLGVSTPIQSGGRDVFDTLRDAGIPVALWMRASDLGPVTPADLHVKLSQLLQENKLSELRQAIQRLRRSQEVRSDATHVGNALTLLWDDPDRRPLKYESQGVFV